MGQLNTFIYLFLRYELLQFVYLLPSLGTGHQQHFTLSVQSPDGKSIHLSESDGPVIAIVKLQLNEVRDNK
jgi:hypothetical protein